MFVLQDHKKCTLSVSGSLSQKKHKVEFLMPVLCRKEFVVIFLNKNFNWKFLNLVLFENV